MDIGSNIQFHRKRLGLSQEELGQKLLVSRQTISLWEKGQTMPTIDNLLRLKEIFGITLDGLFGDDTLTTEPVVPQETYELSPGKDDIRELRRFAARPQLHRSIIAVAAAFVLLFMVVLSEDVLVPMWFGIALCIAIGIVIRYVKSRKAGKIGWARMEATTYVYRLFDDYFEAILFRNGEQISCSKHYYKDITKIYHTKHFLIPEHNGTLYVFRRDDLAEDSLLYAYMHKNPSKKAPGANIVLWKTASIILFIMCFASMFGAMLLQTHLSSVNHLETQNMWVFFLFVPIPAASVMFGFIAKAKGYPHKKNIIAGLIMTAVLCLYGCFTFIFSGFINDDPTPVARAEQFLNIDLPDHEAVSTANTANATQTNINGYRYYQCEVYFDDNAADELESLLNNDGRFLSVLPSELIGVSSFTYAKQIGDYVTIYNTDTQQFNTLPEQSGTYHFICIEYSTSLDCLLIVEYDIEYIR